MKAILQIFAILLLIGTTIIAVSIAGFLSDHYFRIPLHAYVCHQLEPAALAFENGDYHQCIALLQQVCPQQSYVDNERRYLLALSLQSSGHYEESLVHYSSVYHSTADADLKLRAALGDYLARLHIRYVTDAQTYFPDYAPSGSVF